MRHAKSTTPAVRSDLLPRRQGLALLPAASPPRFGLLATVDLFRLGDDRHHHDARRPGPPRGREHARPRLHGRGPNRKWATDITYLATAAGWVEIKPLKAEGSSVDARPPSAGVLRARPRHVAGTRWGTRRYMDIERLREQDQEVQAAKAESSLQPGSPSGEQHQTQLPTPEPTYNPMCAY